MRKVFIKVFIITLCICVISGTYFYFYNGTKATEAQMQTDSNEYYSMNIDKSTIDKGYTVTAFNDSLKLSLVPGVLSSSTDVEMVKLNENIPGPWQLDRISPIYQFEFKNKAAYNKAKPYYIQISCNKNNYYKRVYFYDKNHSSWRPLPTTGTGEDGYVRSLIHLSYARIAVFDYPDVLTRGKATWYKYKGGNFAASPDFPKGSRLRIKNTDNGKFVDVVINDYGPNRTVHPDRVVDLDKVAFAKIAPLSQGYVNIVVEPLIILPDNNKEILGVPEIATSEVNIKSKAAIIYSENSGKVIWAKNATSSLPLASLTKIIAVKVFLETKPTLSTIVAYSKKDEEYNNQFCEPWESAKLALAEGETLTIENLIYTSLVGSTNNTIESLVRVSGLTRDDFIKKMNETVLSWGAHNTQFVEPTGLSPQNVSSVLDYAIITKEALANPIIVKASTMNEYKFTTVSLAKAHRIKNTNSMIRIGNFNITGSKTGYLEEAEYCLMTRIRDLNNNLIVVTFGAPSRDTSTSETTKLLEYGLRKI